MCAATMTSDGSYWHVNVRTTRCQRRGIHALLLRFGISHSAFLSLHARYGYLCAGVCVRACLPSVHAYVCVCVTDEDLLFADELAAGLVHGIVDEATEEHMNDIADVHQV